MYRVWNIHHNILPWPLIMDCINPYGHGSIIQFGKPWLIQGGSCLKLYWYVNKEGVKMQDFKPCLCTNLRMWFPNSGHKPQVIVDPKFLLCSITACKAIERFKKVWQQNYDKSFPLNNRVNFLWEDDSTQLAILFPLYVSCQTIIQNFKYLSILNIRNFLLGVHIILQHLFLPILTIKVPTTASTTSLRHQLSTLFFSFLEFNLFLLEML